MFAFHIFPSGRADTELGAEMRGSPSQSVILGGVYQDGNKPMGGSGVVCGVGGECSVGLCRFRMKKRCAFGDWGVKGTAMEKVCTRAETRGEVGES